jgi:hypothetical protein
MLRQPDPLRLAVSGLLIVVRLALSEFGERLNL